MDIFDKIKKNKGALGQYTTLLMGIYVSQA